MEFWAAEVKVGETIKIDPYAHDAAAIHISQVALGAANKGIPEEPVVIYLVFGGQKIVLGTLIRDKIPQITFNNILEKEFELSHNSKTASVYFSGYKVYYESEEEGETDSEKAGHTAIPDSKKGPNNDAETSKSGGLSCRSCSRTFTSENGLQQHMKAKHAPRGLCCRSCKRTFTSENGLQEHNKAKHAAK